MSQDPSGPISPYDGNILTGLSNQLKLILRLVGDSRVNMLVKLLPIGSLVYFLAPDLLPGPFDDATIMLLANYIFVELCPPNIVDEHKGRLGMPTEGGVDVQTGAKQDSAAPNSSDSSDDIIDAEYSEKKDQP